MVSWKLRSSCATWLAFLIAVAPLVGRAADAPSPLDMTQVLVAGDGKPLKNNFEQSADDRKNDPTCTKCEDLTLGIACAAILRISTMMDPAFREPGPTTAIDKAIRQHLADVIEHDKAAKLSAHQVDVIKKAANVVPFTGALMLAVLSKIDPAGLDNAIQNEAKQ